MAVALACVVAAGGGEVFLVDLAGDVPAVLGCPDPSGLGASDLAAGGADVLASSLRLSAQPAGNGVQLIGRGRVPWDEGGAGERLAVALGRLPGTVIVDAGTIGPDPASAGPGLGMIGASSQSLLVMRPCYLALRRALAVPVRPSGIVLLHEPGRPLTGSDVESVLGVPVVMDVPVDPSVARAVDAGLLASRLPGALERALRWAA